MPGHVVIPEAACVQPGRLTMGEKEKRRRGVALLTEIPFTSVGYRSTRPHTNCIRVMHKQTANITSFFSYSGETALVKLLNREWEHLRL